MKVKTLHELYDHKTKLTMKDQVYRQFVHQLFTFLFHNDVGKSDITSAFYTSSSVAHAVISAKESGIVAGIEEICWLYEQQGIHVVSCVMDGEQVEKGTVLVRLQGNERLLLQLERVMLNILQRMSGIATKTWRLQKMISGFHARLAATRKTHWGLLDKKAVAVGGGLTHRLGLYDVMMVKNNHLAALHSDSLVAIEQAFSQLTNKKIILEVRTQEEVLHAVRCASSFSLLLDNFTPEMIEQTVSLLLRQGVTDLILEASGGITEKNLLSYARTGVDVISMGYLTHTVVPLDIHQLLEKTLSCENL